MLRLQFVRYGSMLGAACLAMTGASFAAERNEHRPVFSPDGSRIAFMSMSEKTEGDWELFVMSADGRNLKRLTEHKGWDGYAVWAPDGESLIFDRSLSGDNGNKTPHRLELASGDIARLGEYQGWMAVNDWSGEFLLAFWERNGQRDLYLLDESGAVVRQLTDTTDISEHDAHFSPDGKTIAFASGPSEGEGATALEIIEIGSGDRRKLRRSVGRIYGIDWSPDGKSIAFTDAPGGEDDDADVFTIDVASGEVVAMTDDEAWDHMPVWTPDGEAIMFTSYRTGSERIYLTRGLGDAKPFTADYGD